MPRKVINYSKTIIYHFVCNDKTITDTYVGHTTDFANRKRTHKCHCINETDKKHHLKLYQNIREKGGWGNWTMTPLEEYPCENNLQARIREQYWIDKLQSKMNQFNAFITEEIKQANRIVNNENAKVYREENAEKIKEWKKQIYECECGCKITLSHKARHLKSRNHKSLA
jgi:hypothetical protein